ncbi:Copper transporter, putative [Theobroma cacao]|uniref:Copper transport protein n=1 Tax=Theobroma cacao TaxID=3641 RepID=A0A061GXG5_THECC|nr:Copper transporter, putative [Theobroma cacao]
MAGLKIPDKPEVVHFSSSTYMKIKCKEFSKFKLPQEHDAMIIAVESSKDHAEKQSKMKMGQMTFFWGKNTEDIFPGWPGRSLCSYFLGLIWVFLLSLMVERLSHTRFIKPGSNHVTAGLLQTVMYAIRVALAYLVMLAVMSFNVGVFVASVAGYAVGFLVYGSRVFRKSEFGPFEEPSDIPPLNC